MISVCVIYCKEDQQYMPNNLRQIPKGWEKVVCYSEKGLKDDLKVERAGDTVNIRYTYSGNLDLSKIRNTVKQYAKHEWILFLDADEILMNYNYTLIESLCYNSNRRVGGFTVNLICPTPFRGDSGTTITEVHKLCRLFKNLPQFQYEYEWHELIGYSIVRNGFIVLESDVYLVHEGYKSFEQQKTKIKRNKAEIDKHPYLKHIKHIAHSIENESKLLRMLEPSSAPALNPNNEQLPKPNYERLQQALDGIIN